MSVLENPPKQFLHQFYHFQNLPSQCSETSSQDQKTNSAFQNLNPLSSSDCFSNCSFNQAQNKPSFEVWEPSWTLLSSQNPQLLSNIKLTMCPQCGKLIKANSHLSQGNIIYLSADPANQIHLIHEMCIGTFTEYTKFSTKSSVTAFKEASEEGGYILGGDEFLVNLTVSHLLGTVKLYNENKKLMEKDEGVLQWNVRKCFEEETMFEPNMVLLPITNFRLEIRLKSTKNQKEIKLFLNTDLSNLPEGTYITYSHETDVKYEATFKVVVQKQAKRDLIQKMNFKYKYEVYDDEPLVSFEKLKIILGEGENLEEGQKLNQKDERITCNPDSPLLHKNSQVFLSKVLKTQNGSKQYQKKIKFMNKNQIDFMIEELGYCFPSLIENEFGNYFVQTLFSHSEFYQRVRIIDIVKESISDLVSTQEGTFTFQEFLNVMREEEIQKLFQILEKDLVRLSFDDFGSHFMRKLIKLLPYEEINRTFNILKGKYIELAENKKGVCVLKEILRCVVGDCPDRTFLRKTFLQLNITHFETLINNEYGNYIIQQIYEKVSFEDLSPFNQILLSMFYPLSTKKYSSIVIVKCLKKYWKNNKAIKNTLTKEISPKIVSALQKNKEGSKVVWELKPYIELRLDGAENGCFKRENKNKSYYSGKVGTEHKNFSSAVEQLHSKHYIK